ncbi:hypothetical protein [Bacillus sp. FJAT-22090]|uniref:hypothetical protein n=1 Tax=Bacillus sp. FJAT-22090 TaxID=1581038 RepID=UPI001642B825|nr:hypothetical protein [Bacillus sp. FJAT-22090]
MSKTMSLKGGLIMYAGFGERYQSDESQEGRKVIYLQKNGFDHQEYANEYFKKNDILTIKEIYVGRSSTEVEFVEYPNKRFNTVMFADLNAGGYVRNTGEILAELHNDFVLPKKDAEKFLDTTKIIEKLNTLDSANLYKIK